jgi:beta-N-acetylhexosaminidase
MSGPILIGERIVFSFRGNTLPSHVAKWLADGLCGGIIFFQDNFESTKQFKGLVSQIEKVSLIQPPLLVIDHEGGRVQRIEGPGLNLPPAMFLAGEKGGNQDFFFHLGKRVGKHLRKLGINVNAAPVLDVLTEPSNRVIGDRALGTSPEEVSLLGVGLAKGLLAGKTCPIVKHFPGHGMTREDSHETLPIVDMEKNDLMKIHIKPFIEAVREGLPAVMTAHILYRKLDADLPATLSKIIVKEWLRKKIGFRGVVISDDLAMKAVSSRFSFDEIARLTAKSSTDILIHCGERDSQEGLIDALLSFYSRRSFKRSGLEDIHERVGRFRKYLLELTER